MSLLGGTWTLSDQPKQGSNTYFEIIFGFALTSLWWKRRAKQQLLLKSFEDFYRKSSKTSAKRLSAHCSTPSMRAHGGDVKLMTHRREDTCRLLQEMTCEMCWTRCWCQRWRSSSAAADSLRWLEKHFGGCYALLLYPSAVSACSLSLHTIKTSLVQAWWAWHRKWR